MFLYLAISRKTSWSEILVNTFFSFCFLFSLSSASRYSRVVCSIVNIVCPFRMVLKQTGNGFLHRFRACVKREREISHLCIALLCGGNSMFRGLAAAILAGTCKPDTQARFLWYALNPFNFQGTFPIFLRLIGCTFQGLFRVSVVSIIYQILGD